MGRNFMLSRSASAYHLPGPCVVPGGRFNEMQGWDSYSILPGLLRDGPPAFAQSVTDNFLYEVPH